MGDGGAHFGSKLKMEEAHLSCKWEIEGHTGVVCEKEWYTGVASGDRRAYWGGKREIEGHTWVVSWRWMGHTGVVSGDRRAHTGVVSGGWRGTLEDGVRY